MRVAIICYYAPPLKAVASHRVLRMSRALLAAGHEVHWVAADPGKIADPDDMLDESLGVLTPREVIQHRLGKQALMTKPIAANFVEKVFRTLAFKLPKLLALPDGFFGWTSAVRKQLLPLLRDHNFDAVLFCCSPYGQMSVIPRLRRALPDLKIFADYRDLLSGNPWNQRSLAGWERRILRHADALFVNSVQAKERFLLAVGEIEGLPVEVMRNAADYDLADEILRAEPILRTEPGTVRTNLGFYGTLFPGRRLLPVLEALATLQAAQLQQVTVHAYTDSLDSAAILAEDLAKVDEAVAARVTRHAYLPFTDALRSMHQMHALLLVNGPTSYDAVFVPGKLYDYLMARRPILFVGGPGDAADIVARACGPDSCFAHGEPDRLAAAITALVDRPADLAPLAEFGPETTFAPLLSRLCQEAIA